MTTNAFPAPGPVKSIQRGVVTTFYTTESIAVTIAAINPLKSIALLGGARNVDGNTASTGVSVRVESATVLRVKVGAGNPNPGGVGTLSLEIEWQILEFN